MRPKRRQNPLINGIDGVPFVQVTVILAALFRLGSFVQPSPSRHRSVDLPRVWHPVSMAHANREDAMTVTIARDDQVFFRSDRVRPDQLPAKIRESIAQGAERKVYIRADLRAKYGWVAEVLGNVRLAGVEKIGFLVYERRPLPAPTPQ